MECSEEKAKTKGEEVFLRVCPGNSCMFKSPGGPIRNADSLYYSITALSHGGTLKSAFYFFEILNKGLGDSTAHSSLGISRAEVSSLAACENHLGDFLKNMYLFGCTSLSCLM